MLIFYGAINWEPARQLEEWIRNEQRSCNLGKTSSKEEHGPVEASEDASSLDKVQPDSDTPGGVSEPTKNVLILLSDNPLEQEYALSQVGVDAAHLAQWKEKREKERADGLHRFDHLRNTFIGEAAKGTCNNKRPEEPKIRGVVEGLGGDAQYVTSGNLNVRLCCIETAPEPPDPENTKNDPENGSENIPPPASAELSEEERRAENVLLKKATRIVRNVLKEKVYDVILVTTGIRQPPENQRLFERIVSVLIDESAPHAQIIFNDYVRNIGLTLICTLEPERVW